MPEWRCINCEKRVVSKAGGMCVPCWPYRFRAGHEKTGLQMCEVIVLAMQHKYPGRYTRMTATDLWGRRPLVSIEAAFDLFAGSVKYLFEQGQRVPGMEQIPRDEWETTKR